MPKNVKSVLPRFAGELIGSLLTIFTLVFFAVSILPIDAARAFLGPQAPEDAVARLRKELALDEPLISRYTAYLQRAALGDFGDSFYYRRSAAEILKESMPKTLVRSLGALALGLAVGVFFAWAAAGRIWPGRRFLLTLCQGTPSFCVMVCLLWFTSEVVRQTPLGSPALFEVLIVVGASLYTFGSVGLFVLERLEGIGPSSPVVDFLSMLHAPPGEMNRLLIQGSLPSTLLVGLSSLVPTITAVSFGEIVFNLSGFGLIFFRSCERGDVAIVTGGTLWLAAIILGLQRTMEFIIAHLDPRGSLEAP